MEGTVVTFRKKKPSATSSASLLAHIEPAKKAPATRMTDVMRMPMPPTDALGSPQHALDAADDAAAVAAAASSGSTGRLAGAKPKMCIDYYARAQREFLEEVERRTNAELKRREEERAKPPTPDEDLLPDPYTDELARIKQELAAALQALRERTDVAEEERAAQTAALTAKANKELADVRRERAAALHGLIDSHAKAIEEAQGTLALRVRYLREHTGITEEERRKWIGWQEEECTKTVAQLRKERWEWMAQVKARRDRLKYPPALVRMGMVTYNADPADVDAAERYAIRMQMREQILIERDTEMVMRFAVDGGARRRGAAADAATLRGVQEPLPALPPLAPPPSAAAAAIAPATGAAPVSNRTASAHKHASPLQVAREVEAALPAPPPPTPPTPPSSTATHAATTAATATEPANDAAPAVEPAAPPLPLPAAGKKRARASTEPRAAAAAKDDEGDDGAQRAPRSRACKSRK